MKGNLARSSCFEESRSYSDTSQAPNGGVKAAPPAAAAKPAAKPAVKKTVAKVPSASVGTRADDVRSVFDEMVLAGVDPADPSITNAIAEKVSVSPAYVRRLIKPMREDSLDRNPAL